MTLDAILATLLDKLESWADTAVAMVPNLIVAVLLLGLFAVLARVARRGVRAALVRTSANEQIASLLATFTRLAVLAIGLFLALGVLRLDRTVTSLLAGLGVVGLALGFAFQDIAANFMSGVIMALRRPFANGDLVETHGFFGTVERVTLRATVLRTFNGQLVIIPNKEVLQNPIVNFTQTGERRVDVEVGVSYGDDLAKVARVTVEAVEALDYRDASRDVRLYFRGFGASSIDLEVQFWLDLASEQSNFFEARSRAVMAIKQAFDEHGVTIPFPIRTLDFGIKGGGPLRAELAADGAGDAAADHD